MRGFEHFSCTSRLRDYDFISSAVNFPIPNIPNSNQNNDDRLDLTEFSTNFKKLGKCLI
jgi:hypothetical protein